MKPVIFVFILAFFIGSCSPSETAIQTAIAQTQAAKSTSTIVPPTVTPTPDTRLIQIEPKEFLLEKMDLPPEAKYYLPGSGWISPHHNEEVAADWGIEEGRIYLAETGRVDGWWVAYNRGTNRVIAPEEIYNNVIMFDSITGAQLAINKYEDKRVTEDGFTELDNPPEIGDTTRAFIRKEMQSGGENRVYYMIAFSYRNYVQIVSGWGWEDEVTLEYIENIAIILLSKLQAAPL